MNELLSGLITGVIFGFLLQKGQVLRYDKLLFTRPAFEQVEQRLK